MNCRKIASLVLLALAVVAAGYGISLTRRGFSARETPSAVEKFAATAARKLAVLSSFVLVLLFGGGGGYYGYSRWGTGGGMGILGTVLLIVLLLYLFGGLRV